MLVLSRHPNERLVLYDRATMRIIAEVCIVETRGSKVRVGFEADNTIGIDRKEVFESRLKTPYKKTTKV